MNNELEDFINNNREAFDSQVPNPATLQRIQQQMGNGAKKKGILISLQMVRWAAACLVLLVGAAIFLIVPKKEVAITTAMQQNPVKQAPVTAPPMQETATSYDIKQTQVKQQAAIFRQALFAKLNNMESPSSRVTGASDANKLKSIDKEIVDALVRTMNVDPNTNVRLAALEALSRFHGETYVKQQLVSSLKKQNDPMVQIQLIQLLTRMRETTIINQLEKMVQDDNTMEAVKDNAYSGILILKS